MIDLYKPLKSDLWFKKLLLSDKETMSFNLKNGYPTSGYPFD